MGDGLFGLGLRFGSLEGLANLRFDQSFAQVQKPFIQSVTYFLSTL